MQENYIVEKTFSSLDGLNFENIEYMDCCFEGLDLTSFNFKNSKFIECKFRNCNLSNSIFLNTTFRDVKFQECKLLGINWSSCQIISNLDIRDSILDYSVFQDLNLSHSTFKKSSLKDVDFSSSKLSNSDFSSSNLRASSFTGSDLSKCDFRNAVEYNINPSYSKIKKAKFSMPEAMILLQHLDVIIN